MASILKLKNGSRRYLYFKRTPAGDIRESRVFTKEEIDLGEPLKWEQALKAKSAPTVTTNLHELFDRYVREISPKKRGKNAAKEEDLFFKRLKRTETFKTDRAIGAVTEDVCQAWVDERLDDVAESTVYREFNTLQDFFRQCASKKKTGKTCWKIVAKNPMEGAQRPPNSEAMGEVVSQEQLAALYAECKRDNERQAIQMFEFAMETGMRRGEVCLMRSKHVGKGYIQLFDGETKSGKGRKIPLSPRAKQLLPADGFGVDRQMFGERFRAVRDRCGFTFRIHDARHTCATNAGNAGFSERQLMDWFGWASSAMCKRYVHTDVNQMSAMLAALAKQQVKLAA